MNVQFNEKHEILTKKKTKTKKRYVEKLNNSLQSILIKHKNTHTLIIDIHIRRDVSDKLNDRV